MPDAPSCFHCGLPVSNSEHAVTYKNRRESACCAGCAAIAQTIIDNGMGDYYERRDTPAQQAQALAPELMQQLRLFDDALIQNSFVHRPAASAVAGMDVREAALILEGISCSACVWLNETHLRRLPGVLQVDINYTSHRARVRWDNARVQLSQILQAVAQIGYVAHPFDSERQQTLVESRRRRALRGLWVAGLSMMQVMMFAVPVYMASGDMSADIETLLRWGSLILTIPAVVYSAAPFFTSAWRDVKTRRVGMDVPVALGIALSFGASVWATWRQNGDVYFDSVTMFIFLLLGGRYLEERARWHAGSAAEGLIKLLPRFAHLMPDWPASREMREEAVARLNPGDYVSVRPGESFPVDGRVEDGLSEANEALMTGESRPVPKTVGDTVIAGSLNIASPLVVKASATGTGTTLSELVRLLDRALADKPRLAQLADRWSGRFVAVVLALAALTHALWWPHDRERALWVTVAVLVATCPCALSLATPAALAAAAGKLSRRGLLLSRSQALDALTMVSDVVFDKTGTLSFGRMQLSDIHRLGPLAVNEIHRLAAAIEAGSEHPIAQAIRVGQTSLVAAEKIRATAGEGVGAFVDGREYRLGRWKFVGELAGSPPPELEATPDATRVWLATRGQWLAAVDLADSLRPEAAQLVAYLKQRGLETHILSGDHNAVVAKVQQAIQADHAQGEQTPNAKLAYIKQLQQRGRKVLMIGDGVNDAPVLAAADVSVAVASGAEIAQQAADLVLMAPRLTPLQDMLMLARRTRSIIRQNLAWAAAYNIVVLPLAMSGWLNPWQSGLGMAASSLLVVINALRLAR